ncbi:hypothetical protein [Cellulomonas carbonis]|uniref:Uncharacterized protein n=1 Tax=Cellulomonas carbonis T26 TaxID=947969 RepID=A0A0A0BVJ8_9CELL|nr:hypothetical protein [Cellulomonas carbonis]KGM11692.1 hypothetical protein N868_07790 [Cellulomonas carbonis T26]GGB98969.1 hypothetical protein GCM10010972_09740 [Cellulomonas carbonis]
MTTPSATDASASRVRARLEEYQPTSVSPLTWDLVRGEAVELALRAGPTNEGRARKDLELIGDVVRHLVSTGVEITLGQALSDTTLASYDTALLAGGAAGGTVENKRGRFRRLQATHRGVPWRKPRRADGERLESSIQPEVLEDLARMIPSGAAPDPATRRGAGALAAAWKDARRRRRGGNSSLPAAVWASAREYARSQGRPITRAELDAAATYEALAELQPAARLMQSYRLTRRDLDLAVVLAGRLPEAPEPEHRDLLRG